jgi:hypothetical protein
MHHIQTYTTTLPNRLQLLVEHLQMDSTKIIEPRRT